MATLNGYITEVRRLLHDANGNFYSDSELTDYINGARERVARDTGCLRKLQVAQTPIAPVGYTGNPVAWAANTAVNLNDLIFSNIFTYVVTTAGVTGDQPPAYPDSYSNFPPSTPFANGTAQIQYVGNVEIIPYASLPEGGQTLDILNINVFWGNSRYPLSYMSWTQFNAQLRYWQNYIGRPVAFSVFGQNQIYISPVPDQVYTIEVDTTILPLPLVNGSEVDTIIDPYTTPVAYYAAYTAKFKEQSYGESEIYYQQYVNKVRSVLNTTFTRRMPDPYSTPF
jgi:hypothetical protein